MYGIGTYATRKRIASILLGAGCLLAPLSDLWADVLILKDGRQVEGLVSVGPSGVCVQRPKGKLDYYQLQDVQEIYKGAAQADSDKAVAEEPKEKRKPRLPLFIIPKMVPTTQEAGNSAPSVDAPVAQRLKILAIVFIATTALGGLAHLVGYLMIMINAFQNSALQGLLCLFFGFYTAYYAIAEYDADARKFGRLLFFGGPFLAILGPVLMFSLNAYE